MALLPATSRLKQPSFQADGLMKYQHPPVLKEFVVRCVRSLSVDDRAAFRYWCIGVVPGSKLDVNVVSDDDIFRLVEFLFGVKELSVDDVSFLEKFLSLVGRRDLLKTLKQVELRMSVGRILEDYVNGFRHYGCTKSARSYCNIVEFLLATKEVNQELVTVVVEELRKVGDDRSILKFFSGFIRGSQLSWSEVTSSLVIIGELYASLDRSLEVVDQATDMGDGYYMCLFSKTEMSEFLTDWMLKNGSLVSK